MSNLNKVTRHTFTSTYLCFQISFFLLKFTCKHIILTSLHIIFKKYLYRACLSERDKLKKLPDEFVRYCFTRAKLTDR